MKKSFNIVLALVIAFFTILVGGITASAVEKVHDDIADGEYDITAKALHADKDEASGAAGFIGEEAKLSVKDGEIELTIAILHNEMAEIEGLQIEGKNPKTKDEETGQWTYKLDKLATELASQVQYAVPAIGLEHDVPFRFILEGIVDLPVKEEEPAPAPEERVVDTLITESEADAVYKLEYETDSNSTRAQLENPVKLLEKDGKEYIQIPINERGANYFRSLEINGKQVTWNSIKKGPYTIQFELPGNIEDTLTLDMVIQAGPNAMEHNDIEISFNTDTIEAIKEPDPDPKPELAPEERIVGTLIMESEADAVYKLEYETDSSATSAQLLNPVKLLEKDGKEYIQIPINERGANYFRSLEINGKQVTWNSIKKGPYTIQFELPGNIEDTLTLDMVIQAGPNVMEHNDIEISFNTDSIETIIEPEPKPEPAPEKTAVDYVVKHATKDEPSAADSFFTKPAQLIERDGETYIQLTITSWSMIDGLRTDLGDVEIIKVNDDDSVVVEFKVTGELSDAINLKMKVTVPGLYEMEHDARIFLEIDEKDSDGESTSTPTPAPKPIEPKPTPNTDPKPEEKLEFVPDKAFEIDYVVKHATEDKASAADSFFKKPAFLLYGENGEKYIQLIVNDWNMIDWLRTEHGDVIVVRENNDGSALIQFKVDGDLANEILLNMSVTVPGLYSMEHEARLIFDVESQKEINVSEFKIIVDQEIPTTDPSDPKGPGKPAFGNGDNIEENNDKDAVTPGKNNNPQTGDTTSILLYSMLFIGSLIPLAVKLRRRFV